LLLLGHFSSEFNCKFQPRAGFTFKRLTKHLSSKGFFIVTSSTNDDEMRFECQIFASGDGGILENEKNVVMFLANIKIIMSSSSILQCTSKSTKMRINHYFIAKFQLGDLMILTE